MQLRCHASALGEGGKQNRSQNPTSPFNFEESRQALKGARA